MKDELAELRREQDEVDREIVAALGRRIAIREKISAFRRDNKLLTIDPARMQIVLDQAEKFAKDYHVPGKMARDVFELLIDWSHKLDRDWRKQENGE